ncbi:MAG: YicC family protein [Deltaproteobacteria bacterium RBG_13_49_15]|nr:MAG: YicC family protein [Deltaproteobacteria bacterium RBG_13_49_15]
MMKSMTAYARAEKTEGKLETSVEIRAYNSRYLDIAARIPHDYYFLEERVKRLISNRITRGRVEIALIIKDRSEGAAAFEVDYEKAVALKNALVRLKGVVEIDDPISFSLIADTEGVVRAAVIEKDPERCWIPLNDCIEKAIVDLDDMRRIEGEAIAMDINSRLETIEKIIDAVEKEQKQGVGELQEKLTKRLTKLIRSVVGVDPDRVAQEVAILADKRDISEEISRAKSHMAQFRTIMTSEEPAGRKLNFLLQEFNREFNTMGSKAENAFISHMVVESKFELEKIREQVLNLE